MPPRPINIIMPLDDEYYRQTLRERSHKLAPALWECTNPTPTVSWSLALQDPTLQDAMAICLATAEMCIRLVDVLNSPIRR